MTEPTYDVMPMGEIDRVDPYPFHGLVFRLSGTGFTNYLDPMDGRPVINLPPRPSVDVRYLPAYFQSRDGCIWDISREVPPETPAITAASGKALGRRLLERSATYPARLGDKTRQIELFAFEKFPGVALSPIEVFWRIRGDTGPQILIGEFDNTHLAFDFATVCDEQGRYFVRPGFGDIDRCRLSIVNVPIAISADGTKRLLRATASIRNTAGTVLSVFTAGYIEVVFGLNPEGEIVATATVVKTCPEVVGAYSRSGSSALKRLVGSNSAGPACERSFELVDSDELLSSAGTSTVTIQRSGIIVGAVYEGATLEFFQLSQDYSRDQGATLSRESYRYGSPDAFDPTICNSVGGEPPTPILASFTTSTSASTTIEFGSYALTTSLSFESSGSSSDGVGTTTASSSSSAGDSIENSGGWVEPVLSRYSEFEPPAGALVVPEIEAFSLGNHLLYWIDGLYGWQTMVVAVKTSDSTLVNLWRAPMLTPSGVKLGYVRQDGVPTSSSYVYGGAYNPLTGQAARNGDVPGKTIEGWI